MLSQSEEPGWWSAIVPEPIARNYAYGLLQHYCSFASLLFKTYAVSLFDVSSLVGAGHGCHLKVACRLRQDADVQTGRTQLRKSSVLLLGLYLLSPV